MNFFTRKPKVRAEETGNAAAVKDESVTGESISEGRKDDGSGQEKEIGLQEEHHEKQNEPNIAVDEAAAAAAEIEYVTGWRLWSMLASLVLIFVLLLLDMSIIATAIPKITSHFHSLHDVGWYGSAYLLANCALQPLTGKLYTRFDTKSTFISFFALFEFGSLLCGAATSSTMLIIGRAIAGMGGSGIMNGGIQIIYLAVPGHRRPALMGVLMSFSQLGLVGGPLIGGLLTEYVSWRWCFYINLPVGAVATVFMTLVQVPDGTKKRDESSGTSTWNELLHDMDLKGFALFAGFSIMAVLALQWGGTEFAWPSATIIGLFVGSGCALLIFAVQEYRIGDRAMFPWAVVRQTVTWSSGSTIFFFFGSQMIGNYYLPIYFQTVRNASPAMSGVYILPVIFGTMLMSVVSGTLVSKWGYYLPWMIASSTIAAVGCGLISTLDLRTSTVKWVWYEIIMGLGRGAGMQMTIISIQTCLPPPTVPIGQAFIIFLQNFGGAFFLAIAQTLFNSSLSSALSKYAPSIDAQAVIHAGASGVRDIVAGADLPAVLRAYVVAVRHEFYLGAACSAVTLVTCLGMGWGKVAQKGKGKKEMVNVKAMAPVEKEAEVRV